VAGALVPAAVAGPGAAFVPGVQLDEELEHEGSEDKGAGEGGFAEEIAESVELEVAPLPCWEGHPLRGHQLPSNRDSNSDATFSTLLPLVLKAAW